MKLYIVGGAVRDALLGLPESDRDWVAVGATPDALLAQGYKPVGKDFPVFLHPQTHEEVALARTERKTGPGYHGFAVHAAPGVTLDQDLARRDLTINAIARAEDGTLVDPFNGQADLRTRTLRHVSDAFVEDPVRLLRLARFAARFPDFSVAPETMALLRQMVANGEVDALVPERVWQELSRGLMAQQPSRMLTVMRDCGALRILLPEVDRLWGVPQPPQHHPEVDTGAHLLLVLDQASRFDAPLPVRWACLVHDLGKGTTPADVLPRHIGHEERSAKLARALAERLRVPNDCRELADVVAREHGHIHQSGALGAAATVRLLERCDAFRRPERLDDVLLACECDARGRTGLQDRAYPQRARLNGALAAARAVNTAGIAAAVSAARAAWAARRRRGDGVNDGDNSTTDALGPAIADAIRQARVHAVAAMLTGPA